MSSGDLSFDEALSRLEEIAVKVKNRDLSLDDSLELLEEGVMMANICTEKTDHTRWQEETKGEMGAGGLSG